MFRWLRRREGKRIAAEVGEPPERAEPPDQIAELLRVLGENRPVRGSEFLDAKKARPTISRRHRGRP